MRAIVFLMLLPASLPLCQELQCTTSEIVGPPRLCRPDHAASVRKSQNQLNQSSHPNLGNHPGFLSPSPKSGGGCAPAHTRSLYGQKAEVGRGGLWSLVDVGQRGTREAMRRDRGPCLSHYYGYRPTLGLPVKTARWNGLQLAVTSKKSPSEGRLLISDGLLLWAFLLV